jgi:hypothetical protein
MKTLVTVACFLLALNAKGQILTKDYIDNWIRQCDASAKVDSVKAFFINAEYFDIIHMDSAFRARLSSFRIDQISYIRYSKIKMDNYVPGKGTIGIMTIKEKSTKDVIAWLDNAKRIFQDNYATFSQIILNDSKDPVLIIDGKSILPSIAKAKLEKNRSIRHL